MYRTHHTGAKGERRNSYLTSVLEEGKWLASHPSAPYPGKGPPVPIVYEAGWTSELVWTQGLEERILYLCRESNRGRSVCIQTL
jgi:hypothetical protein